MTTALLGDPKVLFTKNRKGCKELGKLIILDLGVIPHIHKSLIGKKGSQKAA